MKQPKKTVNWTYNKKPVLSLKDMPEGVLGFIYRIENKTTGKYYIGRKTVAGNKKKKLTAKEKLLPENNRKGFKIEYCESSGWKSYCGSNLILKQEVKDGHEIEKFILTYCFTKAQITMEETREIICGGALEDINSYNSWVKCIIYKQHILKNNY